MSISPRLRSLVSLAALALVAMPASASAVPKAPEGFLNVMPQEGISRADTARMHKGKVKTVRVPLAWSAVQTAPSKFDWNGMDSTVRAAAQEGLTILPSLYSTPSWMYRDSTRLPEGSARLNRWRDFVRAAVKRYGRGGSFWQEAAESSPALPVRPVTEWQIWNEANFHYFANPVSPGRYSRLVLSAAKVLRHVDPKSKIVLSGLFGRPRGGPSKARNADLFLRQTAARVPHRYIDAIALHPYAKDTATLRSISRDFRKAARRAGLGGKSMYITEIGWSSGPRRNAFMTGSKQAQARQLKSAFTYLLKDRHYLKLRKVFWFAWQDTDPKGQNCSFCHQIGLFEWRKNDRLIAKPAWRTFTKFTRGRP